MKKTYILLLVAGAAACGAEHPHPEHGPPLPTAQVRVSQLESQAQQGREEVVGTVRAKLHATLEAKVSGRISRLTVDVGSKVERNDVVAQLDVDEIRAKLTQADAMFEQAQTEMKRYRSLLAKDAVTQQEFDQVQARYRVAEANVREARSILDYAKVRAPFDGVITHKMANVGDMATPGRPIVELEDPSSLRLEVAVPEALSGFVGMGTTVPVRISALEADLEGTVSEIAPAADPNSRTLLVKLDLPDVEGVRAGQFGRALIPTGRLDILRVPEDAVVRRGQLEIAFVVEDGHAKLRLIKTGKRFGDEVEVVSGLVAGEKIVVGRTSKLVDGQPIEEVD